MSVLGCPLAPVTLDDAVGAIDACVTRGRPVQHMSMNAAKLVKLQRDAGLREAVEACELVTADGQAVVWAARILGQPVPERVTGIDLMRALLERASERGWRIFLLGARPQVVEAAAAQIRRRFAGIERVGFHHGYFTEAEEEAVLVQIEREAPHLLFLALETPAKEYLLARLRRRMLIPFAMGIGGSLDVMTGRKRRAPRWMQRVGLEWLFRLLQDPRRLAGRYVVGNTKFTLLVLREWVRRW